MGCSVKGCKRPHKGHGYCEMHLLRWRKHGDPNVVLRRGPVPLEQRRRCVVVDCEEIRVGRGLCRKHYARVYRRGGDPAETLPRGNFSTPVHTRTWMYAKRGPEECWEWLGHRNAKGYGVVGRFGRIVLAHRAMYDELVGPIASGLTLDHLCANPACVNPAHLEPVTAVENRRRGGTPHLKDS